MQQNQDGQPSPALRAYQWQQIQAEGGIALDQTAFPDAMGERVYYQPVQRGMEIKLKEKLDGLRKLRTDARRTKK